MIKRAVGFNDPDNMCEISVPYIDSLRTNL